MEIRFAELREGVPQKIREIFDPKKLDLEFVDLVYDGGIECDGEAEKGAETVSFSGNLKGSIEQVCGRCLKTIRSEFSKPFRFYYEIQGRDVVEVLDDLREVLPAKDCARAAGSILMKPVADVKNRENPGIWRR
jgi:hypothetical protein